jgi:hypothetical protein
LIEVIYKELYNANIFILETPILIPLIDETKITIFKPDLLNANPKLIIVGAAVFSHAFLVHIYACF